MPEIIPNAGNIQKSVMNTELAIYKKILGEAAIISSDRIFTNSGKEHAAIAMSVMYNSTRQKMQLVVDSFNGDVSNDDNYRIALEKCLNRGIKADIIILNEPNIKSAGFKAYYDFRSTHPKQVSIRKATEETKTILNESKSISHISVAETYNIALFDNDKYRFEIIPSKYIALLSFNDPDLVAKYQKVFNSAFPTAKELA